MSLALPIKYKKSAGVPVTAEVHRLIRQANVARDAAAWDAAAAGYRAALALHPALRHIWIQLGHMLKEAGQVEAAVDAYEQALLLRPDDPEPIVLIAHLHKTRDDARGAARQFARAIRTGGGDAGALAELDAMMRPLRPIGPAALERAARDPDPLAAPAGPAAAAAALDRVLDTPAAVTGDDADALERARALLHRMAESHGEDARAATLGTVFDVTDLVAHFRHHRLPTGIQRVQIEVVTRAVRDPALDVRVCCFIDGREELLDIPSPMFLTLAAASVAGRDEGAPEWTGLLDRLFLHLLTADPFAFRHGDTLVNLGTSWWIYNYYLLLRNAKRDFAIRYVPFIHDFIPIMAADHCVTGVIEDYVSWLVGVFDHADFYLVNSQSTARDLLRVAERLGHRVDPALIEVVPLDADFRGLAESALPPGELSRWGLEGEDYALLVSTIESRKNHILALEAWARLIEAHGVAAVPMLVCVGRSGWLNAAFFARLERDPLLRERVKVIQRVSDEELALLYRGCRFTVYPSHYEGWGLPVTESLCYGRVPVVADNSSLPEAGGEFALFFETDSVGDFVAALERVLFEPGCREALEQAIAERFAPRSWAAVAAQMVRAVAAGPRGDATPEAPVVTPGRYYPVALYKGCRVWRGLASGEILRAGEGWLWPQPDGSRTAAAGGELRLRIAGTPGPLRLYLRLRGLDSAPSAFAVAVDGRVIVSGGLDARQERWVLGDVPAVAEGATIAITVRGGSTETVEMSTGGTLKRLRGSIAVVGLAMLGRDDEAGRLAFIEDAALGGLERRDAYREPLPDAA